MIGITTLSNSWVSASGHCPDVSVFKIASRFRGPSQAFCKAYVREGVAYVCAFKPTQKLRQAYISGAKDEYESVQQTKAGN
tara:strand:+ start:22553 stop:22795 length:243 start_codon:yes stop_codon:yes gene_type:complete